MVAAAAVPSKPGFGKWVGGGRDMVAFVEPSISTTMASETDAGVFNCFCRFGYETVKERIERANRVGVDWTCKEIEKKVGEI